MMTTVEENRKVNKSQQKGKLHFFHLFVKKAQKKIYKHTQRSLCFCPHNASCSLLRPPPLRAPPRFNNFD